MDDLKPQATPEFQAALRPKIALRFFSCHQWLIPWGERCPECGNRQTLVVRVEPPEKVEDLQRGMIPQPVTAEIPEPRADRPDIPQPPQAGRLDAGE